MFDFLLLISFVTSWRFWLRAAPAIIIAGMINEWCQGPLGKTGAFLLGAVIAIAGACWGIMAEQAAEERGDGILPRKSRKRPEKD